MPTTAVIISTMVITWPPESWHDGETIKQFPVWLHNQKQIKQPLD